METNETVVEEPTLDNVLDKYKFIKNPKGLYDNFGRVVPPNKQVVEKFKAVVALPGLSPCPWCDGPVKEISEDSDVVVCVSNPKHVIHWLPWGG